jgi:hypothetical protein
MIADRVSISTEIEAGGIFIATEDDHDARHAAGTCLEALRSRCMHALCETIK